MTNPAAPRFTGRSTRLEVLKQLGEAFREAGIDTAQRDARLLLLHAVGAKHADLLKEPRVEIGDRAADMLGAHAARRLAREPVARILGEWEFWSLPFVVTADTLVPRPDSETVVAAALTGLGPRRQDSQGLRILDLGTGSGCLLIALLHELLGATGVGTDVSDGALETARFNATRNGVAGRAEFRSADWASGIEGRFDLVVSNPPYIADAVIAGLEPEVRDHDPRRALSGGRDGLEAYRAIAAALGELLASGGRAVLEIGADQSETVSRLFQDAGFAVEGPFLDFGHRPRALAMTRPAG
jgi:release factor glutamine methyltransferase